MKLLIATPSPFARKARIALLEKKLPHELLAQNPWQSSIAHNPLGKVPVLYLDDGRVVHDSSVIIESLETLNAPPALLPSDPAQRVTHKQVEAIADGICDAVVLIVTERSRPPEKRSTEWIARQAAKIPMALDELERLLGSSDSFTAHGFGLAEIATGCALGYLDLRYPELDWRATRPRLPETVPSAQPVAIGWLALKKAAWDNTYLITPIPGATWFRRGSRNSAGHAEDQSPRKSIWKHYKRQRRAFRSSRLTPAGRCTSLLMG